MEIQETSIPDLTSPSDKNSSDGPIDFTSAAEEEDIIPNKISINMSSFDIPNDYTIPTELLVDYEKDNSVISSR